jgi:superfamily II DNA/RNA helicase
MNEILDKIGIKSLTPMQVAVGKEITSSQKDVVILSPTGTGKTLAYMLPLQKQLDRDDINVQMLVIVPGRELALQSHEVLQSLKCGLRSMACYGGRATMDEHRKMREVNPQVVFATPGRLLDHLEKGNILCDNVQVVVIDEFDKCLEMGFAREMSAILGFVSDDCRRVLLSATDMDDIPRFVNMGRTAKLNFIPEDEQTNDRVESFVVHSQEKDKLGTLSLLLSDIGNPPTPNTQHPSAIVFLNYRDSIERTSEYLKSQGFCHVVFHGGLDQKQREQALHQFSNGSVQIMVCTDLAARGLDIPKIGNIIHYHLPLSQQEYIHRVGRTARWDASGRTFFLLGPEEKMPEFVELEPEEYQVQSEKPMPVLPQMVTIYIGKGKKDKISKGDIVGFLCKIGGLKSAEIGRIDVYDRYCYAAINRKNLRAVLKNTAGAKIKGMKTVVEEIR